MESLYGNELKYDAVVKNGHIYKEVLESGQRVILISAHFGNIEVLSDVLNRQFAPMTLVMRESNVKGVDELIIDARQRGGGKVVYKSGALKILAKNLKNGTPIALLIDQSISPKDGLEVEFFGQKTFQTHSTSALARKFDAVIIPISIVNLEDDRYELEVHDVISPIKTEDDAADILAMTQLQATALEKIIRKDPKQWFWCHKRWKTNHRHIYG
jgi:KDO2-lipid IV(A) lauroyltransferase